MSVTDTDADSFSTHQSSAPTSVVINLADIGSGNIDTHKISTSSGSNFVLTEDLDGDGVVNVNDILAIVGSWGSSNSNNDLDGSGIVDTGDLLAVIGTWGPCE